VRALKQIIACGSALLFATSALAATVTSEQGQVLLNRGDGYKLVTEPTEASAGHQVIVNPHSAGQVTFDDGCVVKIQPGSVFTISAKSPCGGGQVATDGSLKDVSTPQAEPERRSLAPLIIAGGAAIAVGAVLLLRENHSASP
jgi:hypothetical protein